MPEFELAHYYGSDAICAFQSLHDNLNKLKLEEIATLPEGNMLEVSFKILQFLRAGADANAVSLFKDFKLQVVSENEFVKKTKEYVRLHAFRSNVKDLHKQQLELTKSLPTRWNLMKDFEKDINKIEDEIVKIKDLNPESCYFVVTMCLIALEFEVKFRRDLYWLVQKYFPLVFFAFLFVMTISTRFPKDIFFDFKLAHAARWLGFPLFKLATELPRLKQDAVDLMLKLTQFNQNEIASVLFALLDLPAAFRHFYGKKLSVVKLHLTDTEFENLQEFLHASANANTNAPTSTEFISEQIQTFHSFQAWQSQPVEVIHFLEIENESRPVDNDILYLVQSLRYEDYDVLFNFMSNSLAKSAVVSKILKNPFFQAFVWQHLKTKPQDASAWSVVFQMFTNEIPDKLHKMLSDEELSYLRLTNEFNSLVEVHKSLTELSKFINKLDAQGPLFVNILKRISLDPRGSWRWFDWECVDLNAIINSEEPQFSSDIWCLFFFFWGHDPDHLTNTLEEHPENRPTILDFVEDSIKGCEQYLAQNEVSFTTMLHITICFFKIKKALNLTEDLQTGGRNNFLIYSSIVRLAMSRL